MPFARKTNKTFKVLAGAALAASLVMAPLVSTGAVAADDLIGEVGTMVPFTPESNSPAYWEKLYKAEGAVCYSSEGNTVHGSISADKKTVTLNEYQDDWAGDHWALLVIKAGTTNNVVPLPKAGVAYASPKNNGGNQAAVSHWIVCKGTTPNTTPVVVTPTLDVTPPTCEIAGTILRSTNVDWTALANGDGTTTWTAMPKPGTVFPVGIQHIWTVSDLSKLIENCQAPAPEVSVDPKTVFDCSSKSAVTTTTTTTTPYVWNAETKAWELGEPVSEDTVTERELTAAEQETCPPDTKIEFGAWEDGEWDCGDTQVTQTRQVTTTVYESGEQANPTGTSTTSFETRIRELTESEIGTCPLLPGQILSSCVGDVPYLAYGVTLPEGYTADTENPVTITFVNPDGENYVIENQPLSGSLLWPGASAAEPKMWPGWALVDGAYVPTDGNYAWTRAGVTVRFEVNPSYETVIEYPEATALCASPASADPGDDPDGDDPGSDDPSSDPSDPDALAVTGSTVPVWAIGGGVAAVLAGIGLTLFGVMRRRGVHTS